MAKISKHHNYQKKLGQHFLISQNIAKRIVSAIKLKDTETVFELGTGRGILTAVLCKKAKHVISVDVDSELVEQAKNTLSEFKNLQIECRDGFAVMQKNSDYDICTFEIVSAPSHCDVFVSNLPYSQSRRAIEQLASAGFERCVIMIQKEFASKILAGIIPKYDHINRRAISIIAQYCFEICVVINVSARCFEPRPDVDSVVVTLKRQNRLDCKQIQMINQIFSYRRKRLSSILRIICDYNIKNVHDDKSSSNLQINYTQKHVLDIDAIKSKVSDMLGNDLDALRLDDLKVSDVVCLANLLLSRTQ